MNKFFGKGSTSYELQIGNIVFRWCFLKGGHWKYWWQLDRFSCRKYPKGD